jgi:hypothetical protein
MLFAKKGVPPGFAWLRSFRDTEKCGHARADSGNRIKRCATRQAKSVPSGAVCLRSCRDAENVAVSNVIQKKHNRPARRPPKNSRCFNLCEEVRASCATRTNWGLSRKM